MGPFGRRSRSDHPGEAHEGLTPERRPPEPDPAEPLGSTSALDAEQVHTPLLDLRQIARDVTLPDGDILHILRGVNLQVWPGDHIAILGRSGSGKTTLMNLLGLIDRQTSGDLFLEGEDVARMRDRTRAKLRGRTVGFVFQQFNLLERRTALENVTMPLFYGNARQFLGRERIARAMLERVGLADRADQKPNRLSGGEQQRVAVARALVRRPRLILADEPTGALDVATGEAVMTMLDAMAGESGAALVTITHDLHVASLARRTYLLDEGVLHEVDIDTADQALASTTTTRTTSRRGTPATEALPVPETHGDGGRP